MRRLPLTPACLLGAVLPLMWFTGPHHHKLITISRAKRITDCGGAVVLFTPRYGEAFEVEPRSACWL